jgi:LPXTG-motif cell wall-anchored protein
MIEVMLILVIFGGLFLALGFLVFKRKRGADNE